MLPELSGVLGENIPVSFGSESKILLPETGLDSFGNYVPMTGQHSQILTSCQAIPSPITRYTFPFQEHNAQNVLFSPANWNLLIDRLVLDILSLLIKL